MKTIKLGYKGDSVVTLCRLLRIPESLEFNDAVKSEVLKYQKLSNLSVDGVVGSKTWLSLFIRDRLENYSTKDLIEFDYSWSAKYLDCDIASIKAVIEVETGGRGGFVSPGFPQILFEGHHFWKYLKEDGLNPESLAKTYPTLIYPSWTKKYYLGGIREYDRFNTARSIDEIAAIKSTSFGMFQILGSNYKLCSTQNPKEFFERMCESQFQQFVLGIEFIRNSNLSRFLSSHDWLSFAKGYNGPRCIENGYPSKLEGAWKKYIN